MLTCRVVFDGVVFVEMRIAATAREATPRAASPFLTRVRLVPALWGFTCNNHFTVSDRTYKNNFDTRLTTALQPLYNYKQK